MKTTIFAALATVFAANLALAATTDTTQCTSEEHYPLITKTELKKVAGRRSTVVFDVNSKESFAKAHVPGAIHWESHETDYTKFLPPQKNGLIVAYCGGTKCGAWIKAAEAACKAGYTNIKHYKEGITGWVKND